MGAGPDSLRSRGMNEMLGLVETLINHFIDCSECREKLRQLVAEA